LLGAYVEGKHRVSARLVNRAAREVLGKPAQPVRWLAAGILAASAAGVAWAFFALPENPAAGTDLPAAPAASLENQPDTEWRKVERTNPEAPSSAGATDSPEAAAGQERSGEPAAFGEPEAASSESLESEISGIPTLTVVRPERKASAPDTTALTEQRSVNLRRPDISNERSKYLAYARVFEQWGANYSEADRNTIPCNFAPSAGLQCLGRTGSLADIRALNLPVVLELLDKDNEPFYGAVTALKDDVMTLHLADKIYQITSADLRNIWFGGFVVLWQMPPNYQGNLKRGDRHPSIVWLRQQLESLSSEPIPGSDQALFDAGLYTAVLDFQNAEQLLADGVVGPATWIRLSTRLALPAPKLAENADG
jgi:general secretion pathway protein A